MWNTRAPTMPAMIDTKAKSPTIALVAGGSLPSNSCRPTSRRATMVASMIAVNTTAPNIGRGSSQCVPKAALNKSVMYGNDIAYALTLDASANAARRIPVSPLQRATVQQTSKADENCMTAAIELTADLATTADRQIVRSLLAE